MTTREKPFFRTFLIFGILAVLVAPKAARAITVVWKIGEFDHSSAEFMQAAPDGSGAQSPETYIIGKSQPGRNWPAFQPGSLNDTAGHHPHPCAIRFNLPTTPHGLYTLRVGFIADDNRSIMQLEINGRRGWAFEHPRWDKAWTNGMGEDRWATSVAVELPTDALRQGENVLVLTAMDDPSSPGGFEESGLHYDALELDQDSDQSFNPGDLTLSLEPTIFYKQKAGQLIERVNAYIHHNSPLENGRIDLMMNGREFSGECASGHDFGEECVELDLPAFSPETKVSALVAGGSQQRRFAVILTPQKRWKMLIVPHEHFDLGYNYFPAQVAEFESRILDEAIQLIHDRPDFRYSADYHWQLQQFFAGRDTADQQKLLQLMKERKISSPAQYANLLTEFAGVETLIRSFYASFVFDRKNGLDFNYNNLTDVPSAAWSYPSVMAAAGLKYFAFGSDPIRGPIVVLSDLAQRSPFWWEGPDGGRVLAWYAHSYGQAGGVFGMPPNLANGYNRAPRFLAAYSSPEYKSDTVLLYGTQGDCSDLHPEQARIVEEWNKVYAYPKLGYSDFATAMSQIADEQGNAVPVIKGDGGPYWEDGIYSNTHTALLARAADQRAPSAEKISTISSLVHPHVAADSDAINQLWQDIILTDEHSWGAWCSIATPENILTTRQQVTKDAFATQAALEVDAITDRAMVAVGDRIDDPKGTCMVFNPMNWQRNGWVELDLEKDSELVDAVTGQTVPFQVLSERPSQMPAGPYYVNFHFRLPTFLHIRFIAQNVPAMGYKCFLKRPRTAKPTDAAPTSGTILENAYYRIAFDAEGGAVNSIFDKELKTELVNASSPYRFDQYLYVTGGEHPFPNRLIFSDAELPAAPLSVRAAHGGRLRSIERTPFGAIAHLESSDTNTPRIETEVILFNSEKKIEFINHVRKDKVETKEAVYFAFPFAMDKPEFRYDGQNGVIDPSHDLLPGAAKEWFSVQHWLAVKQGAVTAAIVPVDAELVTLGDIVRGAWPTEFGQRQGTVFSYVMNNYWFTNYTAAQGGDFTFRYVLTSATSLEPSRLSRWGWEEMTPLEARDITEVVKGDHGPLLAQPLNPAESSFLQVKQTNVVVVNWKTAEDKHGTVLRLLELAGKAGDVEVEIPILKINAAWTCSAMEENQQPLATTAHGIRLPVKPFQIVTVRIDGASSVP